MPRAMANLCRAGRVWLCLLRLGLSLGRSARFASCDAIPLGLWKCTSAAIKQRDGNRIIFARSSPKVFVRCRVLFPVERFRIDSLINRLEENERRMWGSHYFVLTDAWMCTVVTHAGLAERPPRVRCSSTQGMLLACLSDRWPPHRYLNYLGRLVGGMRSD